MVYLHLLKTPLYYVAAFVSFVGRVRFGREMDKIWDFLFIYVCIFLIELCKLKLFMIVPFPIFTLSLVTQIQHITMYLSCI